MITAIVGNRIHIRLLDTYVCTPTKIQHRYTQMGTYNSSNIYYLVLVRLWNFFNFEPKTKILTGNHCILKNPKELFFSDFQSQSLMSENHLNLSENYLRTFFLIILNFEIPHFIKSYPIFGQLDTWHYVCLQNTTKLKSNSHPWKNSITEMRLIHSRCLIFAAV